MKVILGLGKTVDDQWTTTGMWLNEPGGVVCQLDDGTSIGIIYDGRIFIAKDGDIKYATNARQLVIHHDYPGEEELPALPPGSDNGDRISVEDSGEVFDSEILAEQGDSDRNLEGYPYD